MRQRSSARAGAAISALWRASSVADEGGLGVRRALRQFSQLTVPGRGNDDPYGQTEERHDVERDPPAPLRAISRPQAQRRGDEQRGYQQIAAHHGTIPRGSNAPDEKDQRNEGARAHHCADQPLQPPPTVLRHLSLRSLPGAATSGGWPGLNEIPEIAVEISEHGNLSPGLLGQRPHELDTLRAVAGVVAANVVGVKEQEHAASALIAEARCLFGRGGAREEYAGTA